MPKSTRPVKPSASQPRGRLVLPTEPQPFPDPIPGIIPFGSLTIFAGAAGAGKTVMLSEMFTRIRDGRTVWGHPTNPPTGFYYLAADRPWFPTFHETFRCAGFSDIFHYALADDPAQTPTNWGPNGAFSLLESILVNVLKPIPGSLVAIDPAYPLFIKGDQNKARDVAVSMHVFRRLMARLQVSFICCSNVTKERTDSSFARPQDRISGSGAFSAYSDTQIYLMDKKGEGYPQVFGWTPRRAAAEEFKVQFDPLTKLFIPYTGLLDPDEPEEVLLLADKVQQVYRLVPADGTEIDTGTLEELAFQQLKLSRASVQRYLAALEEQGLITRPYGKIKRRKPS